MAYKIKIIYTTGDSFHTETGIEKYIDFKWKSLEMASESLKRIGNHYEFYQNNSCLWKQPECKLPVGVAWDNQFRIIVLKLVDDDGKDFSYSGFWTGYFEILEEVEIVSELPKLRLN